MLVSDSKDGREDTFRGRGGPLEGLRYMTKRRGVMITAVHLGCKSVTIPMDPKRSKRKLPSAKTRVWTDTSVPLFA